MKNLNEVKNYSQENNEQDLYSEEVDKNNIMRKRYITPSEKQVYRKLITLGLVTLIIIIVLFFWGLPVLARLAGVLTILPGSDKSKDKNDVIPPFPPRLEGLPVATNSAQIKLAGFAEADSSVEIFLNGTLAKKLLIGKDGKFEIENFNLTYGENKLALKATDQAGNSSPITEQELAFDNTPPALEISEPTSGTVFYGSQNLVKIAGKTDPQTTVLVGQFWAIVDQDGNFALSYPAQSGENKLEIAAQDEAGNQTKKSLTVFYQP